MVLDREREDELFALGIVSEGKDFLGYGGLDCKVRCQRLSSGSLAFDWRKWFLY